MFASSQGSGEAMEGQPRPISGRSWRKEVQKILREIVQSCIFYKLIVKVEN